MVGVLTSWNDGAMANRAKGAGNPSTSWNLPLVAGKVVPAAPARRRGPAASFEELAAVTARAWQPVENETLGDWRLRAAGGFTRRANSALPLGDPGLPLGEALGRVRRWYEERGLPAYVQTATGAEGHAGVVVRRAGGTRLAARGVGGGADRRAGPGR
ncbi:N-acetyltransferase OS=Streptomyces antimycoticus OX=68175 GN=SSPO_038990 PE=4 SV=1 [Streptomyces antimycoticus]